MAKLTSFKLIMIWFGKVCSQMVQAPLTDSNYSQQQTGRFTHQPIICQTTHAMSQRKESSIPHHRRVLFLKTQEALGGSAMIPRSVAPRKAFCRFDLLRSAFLGRISWANAFRCETHPRQPTKMGCGRGEASVPAKDGLLGAVHPLEDEFLLACKASKGKDKGDKGYTL